MAAPIEQTRGLPVTPPGGGEWTVDLLDQLPDDNLKYEILDGILLVSPSPIPVHQRAVGRLYRIFDDACPDDHEVFVAPLDWRPDDRTSLEPDLLVVAKDRIGEKNIQENPTIVVEVLSSSSRRYDRLLKFGRYAEAGIPQYWITDPDRPSVEVYDLDDQRAYRLTASAEGDAPVTIASPLAVTVIPSALLSS
ncbi:MAG TPA: Uma2 family endonuclease [Nakamurella sp.]